MTDDKRSADIVVVGAGAMGAAVAYQLAKRGNARVILLDAFHPGHEMGSSHGKSRITRTLAIEDAIYAQLARRSLEIWHELSADSGALMGQLFHNVGFLMLRDADAEEERIKRIGDEGIEELDARAIRSRFPQFLIADGVTGDFDPTGGVLVPERCIMAQREAAIARGVVIRDGVRMIGWSRNSNATTIMTTDGPYEAGKVVFAMGARIPEVLKGYFEYRLEVAAQIQHWFQPMEIETWKFPNAPTFAWVDKTKMFYGIPPFDVDGRVKAATEQWERNCQPDQVELPVTDQEKTEFFETYVRSKLASIDAPAVEAGRCLYTGKRRIGTQQRNIDFLIDLHPDNDDAVFISACSGHGFKHSAAIGERVAAFLLDGRELPPEFRIDQN